MPDHAAVSLPQIENLRFGYNPYTWSFDAVKWLGGDPVDSRQQRRRQRQPRWRHWWHHVREEQTGLGGEDAREEILLISVKL